MVTVEDIIRIRAHEPRRIADALARRPRGRMPENPDERLMIIAADHPARGALAAGPDGSAMADRRDLLSRCAVALARPGVHGFLGTADMVEDLTLLGALDGKLVYGSMNRGGLAGSVFELDDRFTGYNTRAIVGAGLDGGKMLMRIDLTDPASVRTMAACAHAVDELADAGLTALVEPFLCSRVDGRVRNELTTQAVVKSVAISAGLAGTSAHTWLKLPVVPDMEAVLAASTLPALILGGDVPEDAQSTTQEWARALKIPGVRGLVIGRSLLYPRDDDVAAAVDQAVGLL